MLGMSKYQMQNDMEFKIQTSLLSFPEYQNLRQVLNRVAESVAETIEKNNTEIERKLKQAGIKL